MAKELIKVNNLKKYFEIRRGIFARVNGYVKAVDNISFYINEGETLGLVGESGCGKSTIGRSILRLLEPTAGEVFFLGEDILKFNDEKMRRLRKDMQIIFQDPYESLNPRLTVQDTVAEAFDIHNICKGDEKKKRVLELMITVGLRPEHLKRYPHEFSGGQRQRICIARALAVNPKFIICDEPVSALDVSIQAQIINLMTQLQQKFELTYLFISHDLRVVKHKCDRIAVMYLGNIVEMANKGDLYKSPLHPYSQALLSAIPKSRPWYESSRITLKGDMPSASNPPSGCKFNTRCPKSKEICRELEPEFKDYGGKHFCACHFI